VTLLPIAVALAAVEKRARIPLATWTCVLVLRPVFVSPFVPGCLVIVRSSVQRVLQMPKEYLQFQKFILIWNRPEGLKKKEKEKECRILSQTYCLYAEPCLNAVNGPTYFT
jgi:hypothetical protein